MNDWKQHLKLRSEKIADTIAAEAALSARAKKKLADLIFDELEERSNFWRKIYTITEPLRDDFKADEWENLLNLSTLVERIVERLRKIDKA